MTENPLANNSGYDLLNIAPGLYGHIARHTYCQLKYDQPWYAMGAALALLAVVKADKCKNSFGIPPSIYCCLIGEAATGKSQAQSAAKDLLVAANLETLLMGKPASDSGILKALQFYPRRLMFWDEFGTALTELAEAKASHRALILGLLMDLYSAKGLYVGREYSTQSRVDVQNPMLSILGGSTPGRFYSSLNESFIEDGFLSRWLFFFGEENLQKRNPLILSAYSEEELVGELVALEKGYGSELQGDLASILPQEQLLPDSSTLKSWNFSCEAEMGKAKVPLERIVWARAFEQTIKIAQIIYEPSCSSSAIAWAIDFFTEITRQNILYSTTTIFENRRARTKNQLRDVIKRGEEITLSELARRSWRLNLTRSDRQQVVEDLIESGIWVREYKNLNSAKKQTVFLRLAMQ